ncbi:hypothetical protein ACFPOH_15915 [Ureibacillus suwonensis]|uniref:Uncharacterized protein n=1 Tax=Ureibacillus suwonensis TaxID=313007 RepID=A0ABW0RF23_9BACL
MWMNDFFHFGNRSHFEKEEDMKVKEAFAKANASLHKGDGRNVHVQTKGCMFDM